MIYVFWMVGFQNPRDPVALKVKCVGLASAMASASGLMASYNSTPRTNSSSFSSVRSDKSSPSEILPPPKQIEVGIRDPSMVRIQTRGGSPVEVLVYDREAGILEFVSDFQCGRLEL